VKVYAGGPGPLTGREIRLRKTCKAERAAQIELGRLLEQAAAGRQPDSAATVWPSCSTSTCPRARAGLQGWVLEAPMSEQVQVEGSLEGLRT
jgi:hypothetical protein